MFALALLGSCASEDPGFEPASQQPGDDCNDIVDCVDGSPCIGGVCQTPCIFHVDCDVDTEHCENGACTPGSLETCGNTLLDGWEGCDDGNQSSADGCSSVCQVEPGYACEGEPSVCFTLCQDGALDPGEECDDGNDTSGDGCATTCDIEPGFGCDGEPSVCVFTCGNGELNTGEGCDDGDLGAGDGCSAVCAVESGYACSGEPSVCELVCGNWVIDASEGCDDGNIIPGDGCSAVCAVESGYACSGVPSVCESLCGNGVLDWGEGCDDGGLLPDDGCSPTCQVEDGWSCTVGAPSSCDPVCGDGINLFVEGCDDGDSDLDDACPSGPLGNCEPATCGDGYIFSDGGPEFSDDANATIGDGCEGCVVQPGYACIGAPSACDCTTGYQDNDIDGSCEPSCDFLGWTDCGGNGACSDLTGLAVCGCDPGYQDNDLDGICTPDCSAFTCLNGGSCDDLDGTAGCDCLSPWSGPSCELCAVRVDHTNAIPGADGMTWATAFPDLHEGIDATTGMGGALCEVWVREGVYASNHGSTVERFDVPLGVSLYGGFIGDEIARADRDWLTNVTTLDGMESVSGIRSRNVVVAASDNVIDGFRIINGGTSDYGGGLDTEGAQNVTVANCSFEMNEGKNGGALNARNTSNLIIDNTVFDSNVASDDGGAINCENTSDIQITNSVFLYNEAGQSGGAIYARDQCILWTEGSHFISNQAGGEGGAVALDCCGATDLTATATVFAGNVMVGGGTGSRDGGAIFSDGNPVFLFDTQFIANAAVSNSTNGGAIAMRNAPLVVEGAIFAGNHAEQMGGAIYRDNGPMGDYVNVVFTGNDLDASDGFHVYEGSTMEAHFTNVTFDNYETGQWPVAIQNTDAYLTNCIVWETPNEFINASLGDNAFINFSNASSSNELCQGGGCNIDDPSMVWGPPGFRGPPTGGSIASAIFDPVTLQTEVTITAQTWAVDELVALFVRLEGDMPNMYTLPIVANDTSSISVWGDLTHPMLTLPIWVGGSVSFVDYRLEGTSGCVNVGDSSAPPVDVLGNPRIDTPDIGAYEYVP